MAESPQVHLVDDERTVRDAVGFLLRAHGIDVCGYDSGEAFLQAHAGAPLRGCIVLDVRMGPLSGLQVHAELIARGNRLPVLFLSGHGDIAMAVDALKKGAFDFIEKPFDDQDLVQRIQRALAVEAAERHARAGRAAEEARLASLTDREREVMTRVAAGKLNKVIADELCISVRTVEVHRARVFAKLGVRSSAEVAALLTRLRPAG